MYNKLFTKILDSSIWLESTPTRLVWVMFIAAMDEAGIVQFASVSNVAHRARISLKDAEKAIARLEGPDSDSGDPDHNGRRIERVPGGWIVLNAEKYRALVTKAVVQAQTRERVKRFRAKRRGNAIVTQANVGVTPSEAVAEAISEAKEEQQQTMPVSTTTETGIQNRSKRPIFSGQRFTVFEWQLAQLERLLGSHYMSFDVHAWFFDLDSKAVATGQVVPQRDGGAWLLAQTQAEATRRGLAVAPVPRLGKQTTRLAAAIANISREEGAS